jgi:prenyltransferase beta subunit
VSFHPRLPTSLLSQVCRRLEEYSYRLELVAKRRLHANHTLLGRYMNIPRLVSWLSSRQYAPEGGFSGRTNKLVDGCYSHWVGGCWPLIQASLSGPSEGETRSADQQLADIGSLFSRNGLIRYILCCCQDLTRRGGLRDKPSKYETLLSSSTESPRTMLTVG